MLFGDVLEEPTPGGEQLLSFGVRGGFHPEKRQQALAKPWTFVTFWEHRVELGSRDLGRVGLQDPSVGLHDLPERPERDALSVGEAPTLTPGDEPRRDVDEAELGDDAALAEARFPEDGDELDGVRRDRLVEDALEQRQIDLAADERRVVRRG